MADPVVPHLGEGLRELHRQPMQLEVLAVRVLGEQLGRRAGHRGTHRDELELDHVGPVPLGLGAVAEEVGDAEAPVAALARVHDASDLVVQRLRDRVEDDHGVAVRVARPVAVHDRELRDLPGTDPLEPHPEPWPAFGLDQLLVRGVLAGLEAPLTEEGRPLVQPVGHLGEGEALDDPRAPERWRRHLDATRHGACHVGRCRVDRARCVALALSGELLHATLADRRQLCAGNAALDGHHGVHQPQALEGVLGVAHVPLEDRVEVVLHVRTGEGGTAQQHRVLAGEAALVELQEVLLHHDRRLHEESGHADRVRVVLLSRLDDRSHRLLDADVHDRVAVVAHDDVDEVLADVVNIALHRGEHERALAGGVGLLHVGLEVGDRLLHDLGRLQHERQLHLAGAEQLTDRLHAGQKVLVDDR